MIRFPFGAVDAADVCVAGVALGDIDRHFAWQAWHLATSIVTLRGAGSGGTLGSQLAPWSLRLFAWEGWHSATWTCILRGRHGAW